MAKRQIHINKEAFSAYRNNSIVKQQQQQNKQVLFY